MIISRSYANKLVREGKATLDGGCWDNGQRYQIVIRHDIQRVDHFPLFDGQLTRIQVRSEP